MNGFEDAGAGFQGEVALPGFFHAVPSQQGGAEGAGYQGTFGDEQIGVEVLPQRGNEPFVLAAAAGENHRFFQAEPVDHPADPVREGAVDAGQEVGNGNPLGQAGGHFLLSPDRTEVADRCRGGALQGKIADRIQGDVQGVGDDFDESAAAGGALVVHDEVMGAALAVDADGLAVLPSHIDDRPGFGEEEVDTPGMAGDFRDLFVGEGDVDAAVAGGNHVGDGLEGQSGAGEGFLHNSVGQPALLSPRRSDDRGGNPLAEDHRLGHG